MSLDVSIAEENLAGLLTLVKQIRFAAAAALTATVQEAQRAVIAKIKETFITRSNWFAPSNYYGIHYKPATVDDLTAEVSTNAYWLIPHETGDLKVPTLGEFLAIPTSLIHPDPAALIPPNLRPRNLENSFILPTSKGPKLFERVDGAIRVAYNLVRSIHVRKQSTVIEPTIAIVQSRLATIFAAKLQDAINTAH